MEKGKFIQLEQSTEGVVAIITPGDPDLFEFCRIQNGRLDGRVYRLPVFLIQYILQNAPRPEESREDFDVIEDRVLDFQRGIIEEILKFYKRCALAITDQIEELISHEEGKIFHNDIINFLDFVWSMFIVHFQETLKSIDGDWDGPAD